LKRERVVLTKYFGDFREVRFVCKIHVVQREMSELGEFVKLLYKITERVFRMEADVTKDESLKSVSLESLKEWNDIDI
jgi:NADP-dependent 3-hydroxy acid dehydrogenase YdfG